jgi:hypothetical protein
MAAYAAISYALGLILGLCIGFTFGVAIGRRDMRVRLDAAIREGIETPSVGIDRRPNPWWIA